MGLCPAYRSLQSSQNRQRISSSAYSSIPTPVFPHNLTVDMSFLEDFHQTLSRNRWSSRCISVAGFKTSILYFEPYSGPVTGKAGVESVVFAESQSFILFSQFANLVLKALAVELVTANAPS